MAPIRATLWNEFRHERKSPVCKELYPKGMHACIANALKPCDDITTRLASLDDPDHGLTQDVLDATDVLVWWSHIANDEVRDDVVDRIHARVLAGMGLIFLHSGFLSKIFMRLMGTGASLRWREAGEAERLWVVNPAHPIAAGIGEYIDLPQTEMYGEYFDVPTPDELIFISWFAGGEVFRSGTTWTRGKGKIFCFRPGHETYPIYHNPEVIRVIENAIRWATFAGNPNVDNRAARHIPSLSPPGG